MLGVRGKIKRIDVCKKYNSGLFGDDFENLKSKSTPILSISYIEPLSLTSYCCSLKLFQVKIAKLISYLGIDLEMYYMVCNSYMYMV